MADLPETLLFPRGNAHYHRNDACSLHSQSTHSHAAMLSRSNHDGSSHYHFYPLFTRLPRFSRTLCLDAEIEAMDAKYYPAAAVLVILSGIAAQCMNVSAV